MDKKFSGKIDSIEKMKNSEKNTKNKRVVVDETAPFKGMQGMITAIEKVAQKKFEDEIGDTQNQNVKIQEPTKEVKVDMSFDKTGKVEDFSDVNLEEITKNQSESKKDTQEKKNEKTSLWYSIYFEIITLIVTFFRVGLIRLAPGTCGSLATIPFWVLFNYILAAAGYSNNATVFISAWIILIVTLYVLGSLASTVYMKQNNKHDPGEIVIDEVVGQIIAFVIVTISAGFVFSGNTASFAGNDSICPINAGIFVFLILLLPFALFRFFDIKKPSLVGWADSKLSNSQGVMLDDVFAGIFAGVATIPFLYLFKLFIC